MFNNNKKTPYEILGVGRYSTQKEIRNRYLQLCKIYHPDINKNSKVDFTEITVAYNMLTKQHTNNYYQHRPSAYSSHTTIIDTKLWTRRSYLAGFGIVVFTLLYLQSQNEHSQKNPSSQLLLPYEILHNKNQENHTATPWQKEGASFREWRKK
ncbi:DnaJ domain-containing protein [Cokeromyces recurvatus]|uniref:DnaJ domain-containing protein n=1 Tax=Cokeromyces recurvatus TaxID=90255 RepID=UPI00221FC2F6|nr:DnaJ domain-containing protein [Cokeromyces recurvatus]KAI7906018.1 DnaJ domain-containing protein [Cokeromyces recurvatus]